MSEEKFEEFLKREADAYQTPPAATPRDEMWAVIAEARRTRRGGAGHGAVVLPVPRRLRYAPWLGMAATLLLGVGIGRYVLRGSSLPSGSEVAATAPATAPASETPTAATVLAVPATDGPTSAPGSDRPQPPRRLDRATGGTPVQLAAATNDAAEPASPMQIASREHLARAEALISVVAATPADAVMDSLTGRWAHDMLTNTRLLLDSPAGDDPARRRLFEDLEMILVQLVQRSGTSVDERLLIDRTLQRTQLLTRLRTSAAGI
ncbi:MAG: hypothetical protein WD771_02670 [Gemmatimonadaceae bacterium]